MSPIKPQNRHLYPYNWKEISLQVREDAGQCCQSCKVANGTVGYRYTTSRIFRALSQFERMIVRRTMKELTGQDWKFLKIVLTVHHLDGDPTNNNRENLTALCQKCHLDQHRKGRNRE